ncbi:MAG: hypothetical protein WB992_03755 [Bryobacteraceae bacterium]
MTSSKWLPFIALLCSIVVPLEGQANDWLSVEELAPGTPISVVTRGRRGCEVVRVTDSELICDRSIGEAHRTFVLARGEVLEVRLEEPEHNQMIAGAITGVVVGGLYRRRPSE